MPSLRRTCILVVLASAAARAPPPSTAPLPSHPQLPSPSALSAWRRSLRSPLNTSSTTGTASSGRALEWAPGAGTTSDRQTCGGCCFSVLTDMSSLSLDSFYKKRSETRTSSPQSFVGQSFVGMRPLHSLRTRPPRPCPTLHTLVLFTHLRSPSSLAPLARPTSLALLRRCEVIPGLNVVSSGAVSDAALLETALTVAKMCGGKSIRNCEQTAKEGVRVAVIGANEVTRDIPEYAWLPASPWNGYRGIGATSHTPVVSCAEENLLCWGQGKDPYNGENICVHELAHSLAGSGGTLGARNLIDPTQDINVALKAQFKTSVTEGGLWSNTYAGSNFQEYWAEGVQTYYGIQQDGPNGGNGIHNDILTRAQLQQYDAGITDIIKRFVPADATFTCPKATSAACDCSAFTCPVLTLTPGGTGTGGGGGDGGGGGGGTPSTCVDDNAACSSWAASGECDKNPGYMHESCKKSCGICTDPPPATVTSCAVGKGFNAATASQAAYCSDCTGDTFSAANNANPCAGHTVSACSVGKGFVAGYEKGI